MTPRTPADILREPQDIGDAAARPACSSLRDGAAEEASPPSVSPAIAIGSIIHALWPSGAWHELRITGQTPKSWLTEFVIQPEQHEKYKVLKSDLSFAAFPGCNEQAYRGVRYRAYTDAGKAAVVEQQRQLAEFFKLIGQIKAWLGQASFESSNAKVRQIARIAGILAEAQP